MTPKQPKHLAVRSMDDVLHEVTHELAAKEVTFTAARRVACMGEGGALGHPRVFYTIGDKGYTECMYCDRAFVLDASQEGQSYYPGEGADARGHEGERNRRQTTPELPGDGLTESATPPPGENLASGNDTVS